MRYYPTPRWVPYIGSSVRSYHSAQRRDPILHQHSPCIGVELEIDTPGDTDDRSALIRRIHELGVVCELDGSLGQDGMELVGPCVPSHQYDGVSPWYEVLQICRSGGCSGWESGTGYGMHVSFDAQVLTPLRLAALARACNHRPDTEMGRLISRICGRRQNRWAVGSGLPRFTFFSLISFMGRWRGIGKYQVLSPRSVTISPHLSGRVEFRLCRSTLSWIGFRRNIELVLSLLSWIRELPTPDLCRVLHRDIGDISHDLYVDFLTRDRARSARDFPALCAKLCSLGYGGGIRWEKSWSTSPLTVSPEDRVEHVDQRQKNDLARKAAQQARAAHARAVLAAQRAQLSLPVAPTTTTTNITNTNICACLS